MAEAAATIQTKIEQDGQPEYKWLPLKKILPWERNPRKNDAAVDAVAKSIQELGFNRPIIVARRGKPFSRPTICVGHTAYKAAQKLGMATVPCLMVSMTEQQFVKYNAADNKTAEIAEWDLGALAEIAKDFELSEIPGFSQAEFNELLTQLENSSDGEFLGDEEDTSIPAAPKDPTVRVGDVWLCDKHRILVGDVLDRLKELPDGSIQTVVTSPPYWGLRDYGIDGQIGLEETLDDFIEKLVAVFRQVRRVLREDGTLWVNMGDAYANSGQRDNSGLSQDGNRNDCTRKNLPSRPTAHGLKPKDLIGLPWRLAFALQADGWYLRSDIIWAKPNPMPESVTDRPTKAHEYVFLLSKSARYFYDADAVREPHVRLWDALNGGTFSGPGQETSPYHRQARDKSKYPLPNPAGRNLRDVWTIPTQVMPEAHFATFPEKLITPCVKAGSAESGHVLDPFGGAGTTMIVAEKLGRRCTLIELSPMYAEIALKRWQNLTNKQAMLESTGQTYEEVKAERLDADVAKEATAYATH